MDRPYFGNYRDKDPRRFTEPRPDKLKDYPAYITRTIKSFIYRLFYVFKLIWDSKPIILILMTLFSIANGVIPVLSAYVSKNIINELVEIQSSQIFNFKPITTSIHFSTSS